MVFAQYTTPKQLKARGRQMREEVPFYTGPRVTPADLISRLP